MNVDDKMRVLNSRIDYYNNNLQEHNRILNEEMHLLQPGDEEVIRSSIKNIESVLIVLEGVKIELTTS
jgi:hypothetical protein